jgi:hypothetical protein
LTLWQGSAEFFSEDEVFNAEDADVSQRNAEENTPQNTWRIRRESMAF